MKNQFSLNIKTPCQENYNQFKATPDGGFCSSCKKEVIDFTAMTANAIANYFSTKNKENICGQFKANQLNTYNVIPQSRKRLNLVGSIGLACLTLFTISTVQAQDTRNQTNTTQINASPIQDTFIVKGNVSDEIEPIPGVNVVLEGTAIGTVTDFDGNFEFPQKLKKGDVLVLSYVGFKSEKVIIENKESASNIPLSISLKLDTVVIMGEVAVKEVYKSKSNNTSVH